MYSDTQAKNGFKTFVATLAVSLLLFGALYYMISGFSERVDIEATSNKISGTVAYTPEPPEPKEEEVKGISTPSVFGKITQTPVSAQPAVVLAGADSESTESTVPATGSETLVGTIITLGFFSAALYILLIGPRKFALSGFEKDTLKKID